MIFPEITTEQVFERIPAGGIEANAESAWNAFLWMEGICEIEKKKVGVGFPDGIIRFYSEDRKKFVWGLIEYKRDESMYGASIAQLLMYLGNFFYDTNILGLDNFIGVFSASTDHFTYIPARNLMNIMDKFEPIWWNNFRLAPSKAWSTYSIKGFVRENIREIQKDCPYYKRNRESGRLDEIIKSIYEEWNLL